MLFFITVNQRLGHPDNRSDSMPGFPHRSGNVIKSRLPLPSPPKNNWTLPILTANGSVRVRCRLHSGPALRENRTGGADRSVCVCVCNLILSLSSPLSASSSSLARALAESFYVQLHAGACSARALTMALSSDI